MQRDTLKSASQIATLFCLSLVFAASAHADQAEFFEVEGAADTGLELL